MGLKIPELATLEVWLARRDILNFMRITMKNLIFEIKWRLAKLYRKMVK